MSVPFSKKTEAVGSKGKLMVIVPFSEKTETVESKGKLMAINVPADCAECLKKTVSSIGRRKTKKIIVLVN